MSENANEGLADSIQAYLAFPTHEEDLCRLLDQELFAPSAKRWQELPEVLFTLRQRVRQSGPQPEGNGGPVGECGVKYFLDRLGSSGCALGVFLELMRRANPLQRNAISARLEQVFWEEYDGVLLHPGVKVLLHDLAVSGREIVVLEAERLLTELHYSATLGRARGLHLTSRIQAIRWGQGGLLDEQGVAAWEVLVDYFFLQRAAAEDIRRASRLKASGESTAARLTRMGTYGGTHFRRAFLHVSSPHLLVQEYLKDGTHPEHLRDLIEYGKSREKLEFSVLLPFVPDPA